MILQQSIDSIIIILFYLYTLSNNLQKLYNTNHYKSITCKGIDLFLNLCTMLKNNWKTDLFRLTFLEESALGILNIIEKLLGKTEADSRTQTYFIFDLVEEISEQL